MRALDRRLEPVDRVELLRLVHPGSFRPIQTLALLAVSSLSQSPAPPARGRTCGSAELSLDPTTARCCWPAR
jgi:hypothetical protein